MKRGLIILAIVLFGILAGGSHEALATGPADKATGDIVGLAGGQRWHSFDFAAHEQNPAPAGKGIVRHQRLGADANTLIRDEVCEIVYVIVEGEEAWFAGPIVYDSTIALPTHWMVLYVSDGGQPGAGHDELQYTRIYDNGEEGALSLLHERSTSMTSIEIVRGNLQVHNR